MSARDICLFLIIALTGVAFVSLYFQHTGWTALALGGVLALAVVALLKDDAHNEDKPDLYVQL